MFNLSPQLWNGAPTPFLTFTSSNATITPAITLSGDGPCQWEVTEADGAKYYYSTNSFSHTRSVAGNMTVRLLNTMQVAPYVTTVNFDSDGIISTLESLQLNLFRNIQSITVPTNSITGSITSLTLPSTLTTLVAHTNLLVGDMSGVILPSAMQFFTMRSLMLTGLPIIPAVSSMTTFQAQNQGATNMTQPRVDAFVSAWYAKWVAGAFSVNCTVNIGGTNADPSGVYQNPFPNPPATPLEMVYVMVNDPFGTGNKTQVWTY